MAVSNQEYDFAIQVSNMARRDLYGLSPYVDSDWWGLYLRYIVYEATQLRASCIGYVTNNCNSI